MLRIYNTLSHKKEEFQTLAPDEVKMYVCGPTVRVALSHNVFRDMGAQQEGEFRQSEQKPDLVTRGWLELVLKEHYHVAVFG